jgi:hypothetical protein
MNQALYAHMNNKRKMKKKRIQVTDSKINCENMYSAIVEMSFLFWSWTGCSRSLESIFIVSHGLNLAQVQASPLTQVLKANTIPFRA